MNFYFNLQELGLSVQDFLFYFWDLGFSCFWPLDFFFGKHYFCFWFIKSTSYWLTSFCFCFVLYFFFWELGRVGILTLHLVVERSFSFLSAFIVLSFWILILFYILCAILGIPSRKWVLFLLFLLFLSFPASVQGIVLQITIVRKCWFVIFM